ncbi:MAG: hypothetical protein NVSMB33_13950 [Ktedonobacteraceae bacterium]
MSRDKGRQERPQEDWDDEEAEEEYYEPPVRRASRRPPVPAHTAKQRPRQYSYSPPRQYFPPRKQRSVWPWLLIGCAGGIILLVVAAAITVLLTIRSATGGTIGNLPGMPGVSNPSTYTQKSAPQTIQLATIQQIQVHDQIGDVTITVDPNATETTVTSIKKVKAVSSNDANKEFDNILVQVQPTGTPAGTLSVSTTIPDGSTLFSSHNDSVDVIITLPLQSTNANATTTPTNSSGTATTTPVTSATTTPLTLNVDMSIGKVKVNGLSGILLIKDDIGDISINQAVLSDGTHVQTGTGNVTFTGTVDFTAKGSNAQLRYKLQSETGNIDATLVGEPNITLDANTNAGTITSDFPINVKAANNAANFYGPLLPSTTPDSQQAVLTLNVSTGNVSLHKG